MEADFVEHESRREITIHLLEDDDELAKTLKFQSKQIDYGPCCRSLTSN